MPRLVNLTAIRQRFAPLVAVAALFLVGPLLLFGSVTLGGKTLVPYDALLTDPIYRPLLAEHGVRAAQNELVADLVFENAVWKAYWADAVRDGEVPLWNPYLFGGAPFLAAGQHSGLYPATLLFLWLPRDIAFGWNLVFTLWLAALGMYALGRALGLRRFAAILMGLAWSLSSLFVANTVFPMIQAAMAWTPILLACAEAVLRGAGSRSTGAPPLRSDLDWLPRGRTALGLILVALATAMTALAGHVEIFYYSALIAVTYSIFRILSEVPQRGWRAAATTGVWLAAAGLTGVLVAAVQLVPLAELAGVNWRSGAQAYDVIRGYAFGLRQALTFFVPDFYGNPAHHAVLDLAGNRQVLDGNAVWGTALGTKNYVEAASYMGLLVPLLAVIGLAGLRRVTTARYWLALCLLSLSFVFGLPTYRLLFALLPGINQLHTPFRWVFPFVLGVVVLAGMGADALVGTWSGLQQGRSDVPARHGRRADPNRSVDSIRPVDPVRTVDSIRLADSIRPADPSRMSGLARLVGGAAIAVGLVLVALLGISRPPLGRLAQVLERYPDVVKAILAHFPSMAVWQAYEFWNLLHLALFLILSGTAVLVLTRVRANRRWLWLGMTLAAATIALDLGFIGLGFNPAVDPALGRLQPEVVKTLAQLTDVQSGVKWGRIVGYGPDRVLWPNGAMRAGIPDVRGYDSIIPKWTVETLNTIQDQSEGGTGMLLYNRIGNLTKPAALAHPMLAALGGRYVVTTERLGGDPAIQLVQDFGDVRIYENRRAMPHAWVVNTVRVIRDRAALLGALGGSAPPFRPAGEVLLEEEPSAKLWRDLPSGRAIRPAANVRVDAFTRNTVDLDVYTDQAGMLVVSEAYFPGWRAWVKAADATQGDGVEVPVYRADGMLRAVPVPAGRSRVHMAYSPMSVKLGLFGSFLGLMLIFLTVAYALWSRFVVVEEGHAARRIAVNSAGPMAAALIGKVLDFAFQMLALRILGPAGAGEYIFAVTLITLADIVTNFGLNLLVTREVSRRPEEAGRYLTHTAVLRLLLWLALLPVLVAYFAARTAAGKPVEPETALAILLLMAGLVPSNLNGALSSIFQAREQMMLPAGVSIFTTLLKVSFGALALLTGFGIVGLAGVSILTNWLTFALLAALALRQHIRPQWPISRTLLITLVGLSWPLMLNHLLQQLFFKIDVLILEQYWAKEVVGWYGAAYKWIDALLIVPAFSVMALFPLLSRRAENDRAGLERAYSTALRWLLSLALPIAVATTFLAEDLIRLLAGGEFLPHGARALEILIWFLPLSYANGLIQYVLIVMDRQRWITVSFAVTTTFNVVANLLIIPHYSYPGAAAVTIATEVVLMLPFLWGLRDLDAPSPLELMWRPALAATAMVLVIAAGFWAGVPMWLSVLASLPAYAGALLAIGGITRDDRDLVAKIARPDAR